MSVSATPGGCSGHGPVHRAGRDIESSQRLGRHRWIVEPTQAWIVAFRKLAICYGRHATTVRAFLHVACALIRLR